MDHAKVVLINPLLLLHGLKNLLILSGQNENERLESIQQYHNSGFTVGIIDTTLFHHPRGQNIYGVYKYWDYINKSYIYAIQLVTSAISTNDRLFVWTE
jgi:hypothetical protein